jgi:hypothetical protein
MQLPSPNDQFYAFPCLNPPTLHFEIAGWGFPVMHGSKGSGIGGPPGGKFSLGRLAEGTGYCVGAVVATKLGFQGKGQDMEKRKKNKVPLKSNLDNDYSGSALGADIDSESRNANHEAASENGLGGVWIIGEPFFRTVAGVFDVCFTICDFEYHEANILFIKVSTKDGRFQEYMSEWKTSCQTRCG